VTARTREGVLPLQLAAINGSAPMIDRLLKAGADPNAPLTPAGDTAVMMAARTGPTGAFACCSRPAPTSTRRRAGAAPRR
jgi:ankyrin repeat protein